MKQKAVYADRGIFRGKTHDGKWIVGFYSCNAPHHYISEGAKYSEVDPGTLGEFTGRRDRNGIKIFEGDFVEISASPTEIHQVVFDTDALFGCYAIDKDNKLRKSWLVSLQGSERSITVIGNKYDGIDTTA
jgi:uncharacterized phage protein (TIGR01671 family)